MIRRVFDLCRSMVLALPSHVPRPCDPRSTPTIASTASTLCLVNASHSTPALDGSTAPDDQADLIIAAALVAFGESGYADTTLGDIAARAGISTSTLLRYFPSKDEIFRDVVRSTLIGSLSA